MLPPYRISANNTKKRSKKALNTDFDNNSHNEADVKLTSIDLKRPQSTSNENNKKKNENKKQFKRWICTRQY